MNLQIYAHGQRMTAAAARLGAEAVTGAIMRKGEAKGVLATGTSQRAMLAHLVTLPAGWSKVAAFRLDDYAGIPAGHGASFRRYRRERFVARVKGPVTPELPASILQRNECCHLFPDPPAAALLADPPALVKP